MLENKNFFKDLKEEIDVGISRVTVDATRLSGKKDIKELYGPKFTMVDLTYIIYCYTKASSSIIDHAREQILRFKWMKITLATFGEILNAFTHSLQQLNHSFLAEVAKLNKLVKYDSELLDYGDILSSLLNPDTTQASKSQPGIELYKRTYNLLKQCFLEPSFS